MTKPTLEVKSGFSRLRVDLTYEGTNFSGWAKQPNERTVQEEVEKALGTITQTKVATIVAGRTDAGVHAKHQVIHTDLPAQTDINNLSFRLNQILDADIRVLTAQWAPDRPLDIELMNSGSKLLLGVHDFFAFCKFREGGSTIKNLLTFNWHRDEKDVVICEISADSFRYNMVRNLVGAAVCVGEGRFKPEWMLDTLMNKERIPDSYVFPAKGLTLISVQYPPVEQYLSNYENYLATQENSEDEG